MAGNGGRPAQAYTVQGAGPALGPGSGQAGGQGSSPTPPLGLTQRAWDNPMAHLGSGQSAPGLKRVRWTPGATIQINTREGMLTTIEFPPEETVANRLLSDGNSFEAMIAPDHRSVSVRPVYVGVDANLNVYGASGNIYTFYIRSLPWDAPVLTDVNVPVSVPGMSDASPASSTAGSAGGMRGGGSLAGAVGDAGSGSPEGTNKAIERATYDDDPSARLTLRPRALATQAGKDYAATASTGNGRIRTDLRIMVPRPADAIIAPISAWRDDRFTYLDFGPRATSMNQWPVAAIVVDRVESPVGTRVSGPNRSVMIVEAIGNVTLRSGGHMVCVNTDLIDNDPRQPQVDEPFQDKRNKLSQPVNTMVPNQPPPGVTGPGSGDYGANGRDARQISGGAEGVTPQGDPTWPNATGAQAAQPFRIETGPFSLATATQLADEVGRGFHGQQPAGAQVVTTPPSQVGPGPYPTGIAGGVSVVRITAASPILAQNLCDALQTWNHACKLY